ncbi:Gmad2 immunoglobulin-like domain-containing protein [Nocardioides sp.]|uniref:Gmad2 immunoglobulin-like domain-containing protein n=1 Tax=Nocardioides sp. TaxID=35761 RepID=UPI001A2213B6|nr:Gmad2 immunoglobulin-like domain-containing protein [Nocardioides sp.]MBJ7359628.1 GerMN domain-containing protein [Nocardioides sp.]
MTRSRRSLHLSCGVILAAALMLAGCGTDDDDPDAPDPTPTVSSEAPSTTAPTTMTGVYYVVDTRTGVRLARELRDVAEDRAPEAAVAAMIEGAVDPDYATTWNPATEVLDVSEESGGITVDLSDDARTANVGSEGAARMVQQLVYTVTEALDEDAGVTLLIEGEPAGELWGVVSWDEPVGRADPLDVRVLVQIDSPQEGLVTSSPLRIEGEAAVFEATLGWRVLDADGQEVQAGFTTTEEGQTFAPFAFPVELEPGTYSVEITEDDPSGGEGGTPMTDTRTVIIE